MLRFNLSGTYQSMLGVNVSVKSSQPSALSTATVQYQAQFSLDCKMFCGLLKCKLDFQHRNLNVELGDKSKVAGGRCTNSRIGPTWENTKLHHFYWLLNRLTAIMTNKDDVI